MSVLYIVLPLALLIAGGMLWAFIRSVKQGQFDDLETPAYRMLFEDEPVRDSSKPSGTTRSSAAHPRKKKS